MKKTIFTAILVLALSAALLMGCAPQNEAAVPAVTVLEEAPTGGVLCLKVNPEIALHYDENGIVTKVEGRNQDGEELLKNATGYEGQETALVLADLVERIGKAGYFVEEADGTARKITLELDPGSQVPHAQFLEDMAAHVKRCVENRAWVGEAEYDYDLPSAATPAAEPTAATVTTPVASGNAATPTVAATLCPICADDDCDEGIYCDDADEKAENQREAARIASGIPCEVCGEYDCDDLYCDDWDEKAENQREAARIASGIPCEVCGEYDCDDLYCDDWDDKYDNDDDWDD